MLPSSKTSLEDGGFSPQAAAWILIACFLSGVFGIQVLSRVIHHFMPSHVVDCDHTHDDQDLEEASAKDLHDHGHEPHLHNHRIVEAKQRSGGSVTSEGTPLLSRSAPEVSHRRGLVPEVIERGAALPYKLGTWARPSLQSRVTTTVSHLVSGSNTSCAINGSCLGYSNLCGQECFKNIKSRGDSRAPSFGLPRRPTIRRSTISAPLRCADDMEDHSGLFTNKPPPLSNNAMRSRSNTAFFANSSQKSSLRLHSPTSTASSTASVDDDHHAALVPKLTALHLHETPSHHHHVPTNAFLSIGLQTSIAIALHKLPEGFITYATNHANPRLGFSVFMVLFIHNITEGFALALPLYLALSSRLKALVLPTVLGGLSQPAGAGVAALWLKLAERGRGDHTPTEGVYGAMFAVTAGIMASVGLSLLQESFELTHNKSFCMVFAFVGMGVLGMSSALTA